MRDEKRKQEDTPKDMILFVDLVLALFILALSFDSPMPELPVIRVRKT
jgi:hypothetical protein